MPPAAEIALMVLNWNGAELMRRHLPAVLEAAAQAPVDARVYVIDNASEDDSRELVASLAGVELIAVCHQPQAARLQRGRAPGRLHAPS